MPCCQQSANYIISLTACLQPASANHNQNPHNVPAASKAPTQKPALVTKKLHDACCQQSAGLNPHNVRAGSKLCSALCCPLFLCLLNLVQHAAQQLQFTQLSYLTPAARCH
jgi:hypothetical protein